MSGDQPNSKKLEVACVSLGKNVAVGQGWNVARIATWASMPTMAWHTEARNVALTQSSVTEKPSG